MPDTGPFDRGTLGLLGSSISYSLSPAIHSFAMRWLGLKGTYRLFDLPADCDDDTILTLLQDLWQAGSPGINVTQPFKRRVASLLPRIMAHQHGHSPAQPPVPSSVNTLYRTLVGFSGTSTDGPGFAAAAALMGMPLETVDHLILLGSGGAIAAIGAHLAQLAFTGRVSVLSRQGLPVDDMPLPHLARPLSCGDLAATLDDSSANSLLVQGTSAPHRGDALEALVPALASFQGGCMDLCYGRVSALLQACATRGLHACDGIPMLIEQARAGQMLWWGKAVPHAPVRDHIMTVLQTRPS